ncbi:galactose oxidase-like domain-containing protein [Streptomyces ipomoeae]|uniref:galactose oxidase-like domain-containing protein n=1 Tax=Streptomyces ipomoeae TaxID=103232 RepID=UPI0009980757
MRSTPPASATEIYTPRDEHLPARRRPPRWGATTAPRPCCCLTAGARRSAPIRSSRTGRLPRGPLRAGRRDLLPSAPPPRRAARRQARGGARPRTGRPRDHQLPGGLADPHRTTPRPGSATHATGVDQRSVALGIVRRTGGSVTERVPDDAAVVPPRRYMAFLVDEEGVPSQSV